MLPARRFGLFSPSLLKSIKPAALRRLIQGWIQQEIVADDPWDETRSTQVSPGEFVSPSAVDGNLATGNQARSNPNASEGTTFRSASHS